MMAVTPALVAIIPNEGSIIQNNDVLHVAPKQLTLRFTEGTSVTPSQISANVLTRAGGDGILGNANDVQVVSGSVTQGDNPNELVVRFTQNLTNDLYKVSIVAANGSGIAPVTRTFSLALGPQVTAVVPQPVTRDSSGKLTQAVNQIEVYFNDSQLNAATATNPAYYQLIRTNNSATNLDDVILHPASVTYTFVPSSTPATVPSYGKAVLTFNTGDLTGNSGVLRLRVGNNDPLPLAPTPTVAVSNATIVEGNSGTSNMVFTVSLAHSSTQQVTVGFQTADGTALAASDYTATSGTLTFAAGQTSLTVTVPIVGDTVDETNGGTTPTEKFVLNLTNAVNATIAGAPGVGTIIDNDGTVPMIVITDAAIPEGNINLPNTFADPVISNMPFDVYLFPAPLAATAPVTVQYKTLAGTASALKDFTPVAGTLTFTAGQTHATINVQITGNITPEPDKTFSLSLYNALDKNGVSVNLPKPTATGTILNDDNPDSAVTPITTTNNTANSAYDLGQIDAGAGLAGMVVADSIKPVQYTLQFPGGNTDPGTRTSDVPYNQNYLGPADTTGGVPTIPYNFKDFYGSDPNGVPLHNKILDQQKQLVRDVLQQYAHSLGVQFVETSTAGVTIAVGDLRAANVDAQTGPTGLPNITANGLAVINDAYSWDNSGPEVTNVTNNFYLAAARGVGQLLGIGYSNSVPQPTAVQLFNNNLAGTFEQVYPGNLDIAKGEYLFRPDITDVNVYKFTATQNGTVNLETIAQRLGNPSQLNTILSLFDANHNLIARNDDYFGHDSRIEVPITGGTYFVAVSSVGNTQFDLSVANSGVGGRTQGSYQLRINFTPDPAAGITDTSGTFLDGDGDGKPGGNYNFWFRANTSTNSQVVTNTLFVDKTATNGTGTLGSVSNPYTNLAAALAAAHPGQIVRVVGNAGADGDLSKPLDAKAYNIGSDSLNSPLSDGSKLEVPQGVTLMIDAGTVIKASKANLDVGSSAQGVDRSQGAIQVLGTPTTSVFFTSYYDTTIGFPTGSTALSQSARAGDWGGIVYRADSDMEDQGIFLNDVNHADIRYGGGRVTVNGATSVYDSVHIIDARPAVQYNHIILSADAPISADPNSFEETEYQDTSYTSDLRRSGPDVRGNSMESFDAQRNKIGNAINGLFVRIRTLAGQTLDPLTVSARFTATDIVYVLTETLLIQGTPSSFQQVTNPNDPDPNNPTQFVTKTTLNGRLAIDPGVTLKLSNSRIETRFGGQLLAEGTSQNPVVFTALSDDRYGAGGTFDTNNDNVINALTGIIASPSQPDPSTPVGIWSGLYFDHASAGSLDHAVVSFAGGQSAYEGGFDRFDPVEIHQADVRIANSKFEGNVAGTAGGFRSGRGDNTAAVVFVRGAQPIIVNNTFRNNNAAPISIDVNSLNSTLLNDTGRQTGVIGTVGSFFTNNGPLVHGNILTNNGINGMIVRGGNVTTGSIWDDTDIVHVVQNEIVVPDYQTNIFLRLQSSATESLVVKMSGVSTGFTATGSQSDYPGRIGGTMQIIGTPLHPVVITALEDDSVGAGLNATGDPQVDTDNNGVSTALIAPGRWRSVKIDGFANDRNVGIYNETEQSITSGDTNSLPNNAQYLGQLAPDLNNGDDSRRLGFEVHGSISQPSDVDVYRFRSTAGTSVYIDEISSNFSLDSVIELVDSNGTVIAQSNDKYSESSALNPTTAGGVVSNTSVNPRDAGLAITLPGTAGAVNDYYVRVRSNGPNLTNLVGGQSVGGYAFQVRLQKQLEIPGSTVRNADIRYATIGVDVSGKPGHSPLLGEAAETTGANGTFANAQNVGNLLNSSNNAISVSGSLGTAQNGDIDWYKFTMLDDLVSLLNNKPTLSTFATMFHISFADGAARPDLTLSVFNENGQLIYVGHDSNNTDNLPAPNTPVGQTDPTHGSQGTGDPSVGPVQLPTGTLNTGAKTYYVAVTSEGKLPQVLASFLDTGDTIDSKVRLEPIDSIRRVGEDRSTAALTATQGSKVIAGTTTPNLNLHPEAFTLADATLVGTDGANTYIINPYNGAIITTIGSLGSVNTRSYNDLAFRGDGKLFTTFDVTNVAAVVGNQSQQATVNLRSGAASGGTPSGIQNYIGTTQVDTDPGVSFGALTFMTTGANRRMFGAGNSNFQIKPTGATFDVPFPGVFPKVWELNPDTGAALADNVNQSQSPSEPLPSMILNLGYNGAHIFTGGAAADGETVSIKVGATTTTFEFDSDTPANFTAGNIPVPITAGGTAAATQTAFFNALIQARQQLVADAHYQIGLEQFGGAIYLATILVNPQDPTNPATFPTVNVTSLSPAILPTNDPLPDGGGIGSGGNVTGIAAKNGTMSVITSSGHYYTFRIPGAPPRATTLSVPTFTLAAPITTTDPITMTTTPVDFEGLTLAPQNVSYTLDPLTGQYTYKYANDLIASDGSGNLWALKVADGTLDPIFAGNVDHTSLSTTTGLGVGFGLVGISSNPADFNLWHPTSTGASSTRTTGGDAIALNSTPNSNDQRQQALTYNSAYYFGIEDNLRAGGGTAEQLQTGATAAPQQTQYPSGYNQQLQTTFGTAQGPRLTYDTPLGAKGSLVTDNFDLSSYSAADSPTLYFDYYSDTENRNTLNNGVLSTTNVRDALRVYITSDGVNWTELATNNGTRTNLSSSSIGRQELPAFQTLRGGLTVDAGSSGNSTALNAVVDNQQVQRLYDRAELPNGTNNQDFLQARVDLGDWAGNVSNQLEIAGGGALIKDGDTLTVMDALNRRKTFEFDSDGNVKAGNFAIPFLATYTQLQMTNAVLNAINQASAQGFVSVLASRPLALPNGSSTGTILGLNNLLGQPTSYVDSITSHAPSSTSPNRIILSNSVGITSGTPTVDIQSGGLAVRRNSNVQLRFDFTSSGQMVDQTLELTTLGMRPAIDLLDGEQFAITDISGITPLVHTFEIDKGFSVLVPDVPANSTSANGINAIQDGETFKLTGPSGVQTFEIDTNGSLTGAANIAIAISTTDPAATVAQKIADAINNDPVSGVKAEAKGNKVDLRLATKVDQTPAVGQALGINLIGDAPGTLKNPNAIPVNLTGDPMLTYGGTSIGWDNANLAIADVGNITTKEVGGLIGHALDLAGVPNIPQNGTLGILYSTKNLQGLALQRFQVTDSGPFPYQNVPLQGDEYVPGNYLAYQNNAGMVTYLQNTGFGVPVDYGSYGNGRGAGDGSNPGPANSFQGIGNGFEGAWLDNVIIGLAGRGEMVTSETTVPTNTTFVDLQRIANGVVRGVDAPPLITQGSYQLAITAATPYAVSNPNGTISLTQSFDVNDRLANGITIFAGDGAHTLDGRTFTLKDASNNTATFEFDNNGKLNDNTHIRIAYSSQDTTDVMAARIRSTINAQTKLKITAGPSATSSTIPVAGNRVDLFNAIDISGAIGAQQITPAPLAANSPLAEPNDISVVSAQTGETVNSVPIDLTDASPGTYLANGTIGDNSALQSHLSGTDVDTFSITATAGDKIHISLKALTGNAINPFAVSATLELGTPDDPLYVTPIPVTTIADAQNIQNLPDIDYVIPSGGSGLYVITLKSLIPSATTGLTTGDYQMLVNLSTPRDFNYEIVRRQGDGLPVRDQGYTLIEGNQVRSSGQFGISVSADNRTDQGSQPHPGSPIAFPTPNTNNWVPGVSLFNNVLDSNSVGGISLSGDPLTNPLAPVLLARVVNNTIYGTHSGDVGIQVGQNSSPTILNNIIANTNTAIDVATTSGGTILNYNLYQRDAFIYSPGTSIGVKATETNGIQLLANDPLFVDPLNHNFYLVAGSKAIDSALDSLQDRSSMIAVASQLGIGPSPILAPDLDLFGQLRQADPNGNSGTGQNIFKDRGAIDRVDFTGPTVKLLKPVDNSADDRNSAADAVKLVGIVLTKFDLQFVDAGGIGISDAIASNPANYILTKTGSTTPLVLNTDYLFSYDATNHVAHFAAAQGIWLDGVYKIDVARAASTINPAVSPITDLAGNVLQPNNLTLNTTSFQIDLSSVGVSPFQNPTNQYDVSGNGQVSPLDALLIINALNANNGNAITLPSSGNPPPYYDVNGDGLVTPLDALLVINRLNQIAAGLTGNSLIVSTAGVIDAAPTNALAAVSQVNSPLNSPLVANDLALASYANDSGVSNSSAVMVATSSFANAAAAGWNAQDDDWNDLLGDLAQENQQSSQDDAFLWKEDLLA
jgi:hypothetical protein